MAIEYIVDLVCPVKEILPPAKFMYLIKMGNMANVAIALAGEAAKTKPLAEFFVKHILKTPTGTQEQQVSIQTMLDAAAELRLHEHRCQGCRGNMLNRSFGCYGSISYPVQAETEQRLMDLLPQRLESTAGSLLREVVRDFKYDGHLVRNMRRRHLFERTDPIKRTWGFAFAKWEFDSNQLLEMMFCVGAVQPNHSMMLALFLGMIPHDIRPELLQNTNMLRSTLADARLEKENRSPQMNEVAGFFKALKTALDLDANLYVDC